MREVARAGAVRSEIPGMRNQYGVISALGLGAGPIKCAPRVVRAVESHDDHGRTSCQLSSGLLALAVAVRCGYYRNRTRRVMQNRQADRTHEMTEPDAPGTATDDQ